MHFEPPTGELDLQIPDPRDIQRLGGCGGALAIGYGGQGELGLPLFGRVEMFSPRRRLGPLSASSQPAGQPTKKE